MRAMLFDSGPVSKSVVCVSSPMLVVYNLAVNNQAMSEINFVIGIMHLQSRPRNRVLYERGCNWVGGSFNVRGNSVTIYIPATVVLKIQNLTPGFKVGRRRRLA